MPAAGFHRITAGFALMMGLFSGLSGSPLSGNMNQLLRSLGRM